MTNLGLRVLELPDPSVLEGNIRQGGETQARGEGAPSATKDVKRQFFFNSQRVVAPATFPPLTANFNAVLEGESDGERERGREEINGGTSRAVDQRTDGPRPMVLMEWERRESATMRLQNANTP